MVYCVQGALAFTSSARRNAVVTDIQTRISARPRFGTDVLKSANVRLRTATLQTEPRGVNGIRFEMRFTNRSDADDLIARIQAFATGLRLPVAGSFVAVHNCTHDGTPDPCVTDLEVVW